MRKSIRAAASLHEGFDANLPGSKGRRPYAPNLPLIDPRVLFGGGVKSDVSKDIEYRLTFSQRRLAVTGQSNSLAIVCLDDQVQVELHASISANFQKVEALRPAREATVTAPINREVKPRALQWNRSPTSEEIIQAKAEVRYSGEIEFLVIDLLAPHCRICSHRASPV
jgi:hypothetical protein